MKETISLKSEKCIKNSTRVTKFDSESKLRCGELFLLTGRSDEDRREFAIITAINVAAKQEHSVAIFTLELSNEQITDRILLSQAGINCVNTSDLTSEEWKVISDVITKISDYPIFLDDTLYITVSKIKEKVLRLNENQNKPDISLVIIDCLELISVGEQNSINNKENIEIILQLKNMAKETNVAVIALSQNPNFLELDTKKKYTYKAVDLNKDNCSHWNKLLEFAL